MSSNFIELETWALSTKNVFESNLLQKKKTIEIYVTDGKRLKIMFKF